MDLAFIWAWGVALIVACIYPEYAVLVAKYAWLLGRLSLARINQRRLIRKILRKRKKK